MPEIYKTHEFPELAKQDTSSDGICLEVKPRGMHERRKARLRYTVDRGWERYEPGAGWRAEKE